MQEINRKGRISPLPQAVQGAQPQLQGPADEPRIKSEFGRMFSGIGSGVRGIGAPSPVPGGAQLAHSNARRDDDTGHEHVPEPPAKPVARGKRRKAKEDDGKGDDESTGRRTPVGRAKRAKTHAHHHHHQYVQVNHPPLLASAILTWVLILATTTITIMHLIGRLHHSRQVVRYSKT